MKDDPPTRAESIAARVLLTAFALFAAIVPAIELASNESLSDVGVVCAIVSGALLLIGLFAPARIAWASTRWIRWFGL